jgi:glycosyltransferase involved in cell wall biosynthesis
VHLTALVERVDHVCCRYRVAAFRPFWERADCHLTILPLPSRWWDWFSLSKALRRADAVLLQRKLLQPWQLRLLRRSSRFLLFDLDDAVFLRDSFAKKGLHCKRRERRYLATVAAADAVVAGNPFLKKWTAHWTHRDHVHVIPTCVDPSAYPLAGHQATGLDVQLVWVGSSSTLKGLHATRPLLEHLGRSIPGIRLKLVCDRFLELRDMPVVPCPWKEATEAAEIAAADIGISWLPDDLWSRGKCGLKVLQYMAAGLPVVANPVGVQAEMVRDGETGFLAETPAQWAEAIGRLAYDPALRRQMGQAARRRVEEEFSLRAGAERWQAVLDRARPQRNAA